jgi:Glycosyltransferase Family 4
MGLRVLIASGGLWPPSGTVTYVRDLALELNRQGHLPVVFSSTRGAVAAELSRAGIRVIDSLGRTEATPDVIHGHQHAPTLVAVRRWPAVPAIFVCHSHTSPHDRPPLDPGIRRYFGVSSVCLRRLVNDGAPASRSSLLLNFVDTVRFAPRPALPERPRRALVFSNYAHDGSHLPAVVEACREVGLELDVVGEGVGRIETRPERLLGQYDLVFAKAKAAMEAMAVGTAVILCDFSGVGPMVTSAEFDRLRPLNFGFEAMRGPLRPGPLLREIARYDAADAARVRDLLRSRAGLVTAVDGLVAIYREQIADGRSGQRRGRPHRSAVREWAFLRLYWWWGARSPIHRQKLKGLPGVRLGLRLARRLLGEPDR